MRKKEKKKKRKSLEVLRPVLGDAIFRGDAVCHVMYLVVGGSVEQPPLHKLYDVEVFFAEAEAAAR